MSWDAYAEQDWLARYMRVTLADRRADGLYVAQPVDLSLQGQPESVVSEPTLHLPIDAARPLYDALGRALGVHTPDARLAAEVLQREQQRVDKMLDHLVGL